MIDAIQETEEERDARIEAARLLLERRTQKALQGASELALHVRSLAVNGKTERGETLPEWSAPMRITAVDDLDEVYAQLINWVSFWAETLEVAPPSTAVVAWSNLKEVQGFRAGTTPEGAQFLVRLQTMWLGVHAPQIRDNETVTVYQEDIVNVLGALRGKYPMAPRPPREISERPCTTCGEYSVGAEWNSDDLTDVTVQCAHCGEEYPTSPRSIIDWLTPEAQLHFEKTAERAGVDPYTGLVAGPTSQDSTTGATND